jgi:hypothetical protein
MTEVPVSARPALRRLSRRLAVGQILDVWPSWAAAGLLAAGIVALTCRLLFPRAAAVLPWLWLVPLLALVPALTLCVVRRYRLDEVIVLADWLGGGEGALLTAFETGDPSWSKSALVERASTFALPRIRPWRKLAVVPPAAAFLAAAMLLPQRTPGPANTVLADEIAEELTATMTALKQQDLITPAEEQQLEMEIARIRRGAEERVDASSWEAADALRERMAASLADKQDAMKWADDALGRYAAGQANGSADANAEAHAAELAAALERLAKSGLLAGAPADVQRMLAAGKLAGDPRALKELAASLSKHLAGAKLRFGEVGKLGKEFGRFDPAEFPLGQGADADGADPGRGAISRGRADAPLTWGKESLPIDRFKASPLPPGAARSADDWAPIAELPGTPQESPGSNAPGAARAYAASAGQSAWRRTLAPRHQSAVKKYFAK